MLPLPEQVVLDSLHDALVNEKRLPSAVFGWCVTRHPIGTVNTAKTKWAQMSIGDP